MSNKIEQPYWCMTVTMDYAKQEYSVGRVCAYADTIRMSSTDIGPHVIILADDEIGAFNEASKTLHRLGFRLGA